MPKSPGLGIKKPAGGIGEDLGKNSVPEAAASLANIVPGAENHDLGGEAFRGNGGSVRPPDESFQRGLGHKFILTILQGWRKDKGEGKEERRGFGEDERAGMF